MDDPAAPGRGAWAERENLAEMRRVTVAVRRRESLAVAPEVFADFLLRRQHVHPATVGDGAGFVEVGPGTTPGFAAPAAVWEKEILPRRVKGYRPAWLDEVLGQGAWLWRAAGTPATIRASRFSSATSRDIPATIRLRRSCRPTSSG